MANSPHGARHLGAPNVLAYRDVARAVRDHLTTMTMRLPSKRDFDDFPFAEFRAIVDVAMADAKTVGLGLAIETVATRILMAAIRGERDRGMLRAAAFMG